MKNCPTCDLDFEDEFLFCAEDGSRLEYLVDMPQTTSKQSDSYPIKPATVNALYCPACQREYPLTFVVCPVDGLLLTRQKLAAKKKEPPVVAPPIVAPQVVKPMIAEPRIVAPPIEEPMVIVRVRKPQQNDAFCLTTDTDANRVTIRQAAETVYDEMAGALSRIKSRLSSLRDQASKSRESKPLDLRVVARVTTIGLSLFAVLALYAAYDYVTSRPAVKPGVEKTEEVAEVSPLIPTPEAARNYTEESDAEADDKTADETIVAESTGEKHTIETPRHSATKQLLSNPERQPTPSNAERQSKSPEPRTVSAPAIRGPVPSQSTGGRINARLLRVRSNKARPGVRYDLTFVLQEEAGDAVRWDRMVISTRSAKGLNQTQTIPFHHRQGASGTLTFTVSVQMFGPSEADLRGRILCTTIGSDPAGRTMRASFGADVAP